MKKLILPIALACLLSACDRDSDGYATKQQETILLEAARVGMPNIKNFREKRILKDILELRDQEGLVTIPMP